MSFNKLSILFFVFIIPFIAWGQPFIADDTVGCNPFTVQFTAELSGTTTWNWDFGDGSPNVTDNGIPSHTYTVPGIYDIALTIDGGSDTIENFIRVLATPQAYFDTTTIKYASFTILCTDTSVYQNLWYFVWKFENDAFVDTNQLAVFTHKYDSEKTDTIKHYITDANGCTDSTFKIVNIKHQFIIPNVFTPNEDGINDRFIVLANGLDIFPVAYIYNRWGNIVYKFENVSQIIWDGRTFDGSLVSPGVYFYVITPPGNSNYEYLDSGLKGTIQIIYN